MVYKKREKIAIEDNPGKIISARNINYGETMSERSDTDTNI